MVNNKKGDNNMNSNDINQAQEVIEQLVIDAIRQPMKDFVLIKKYLDVLKDIDKKRRIQWNDEKFGVYDNVINAGFNSDDIPF